MLTKLLNDRENIKKHNSTITRIRIHIYTYIYARIYMHLDIL